METSSFYGVFIFIICWMVSRIAYFTDSFINYSYDVLAILTILPIIFTYVTILIIVYNVLNLCQMIESRDKRKNNAKCKQVGFYSAATFCILTQFLDLFLIWEEPENFINGTEYYGDNSKSFTYYVIRNVMVTISAFVLSGYSGYYSVKMLRLIGQTNFDASVRTKIIIQAIII